MNPRICWVQADELPPGWTRKAPHPEHGLDTGFHWTVITLGADVAPLAAYDVIIASPAAWALVQSSKDAARWWGALIDVHLAGGGVATWTWPPE